MKSNTNLSNSSVDIFLVRLLLLSTIFLVILFFVSHVDKTPDLEDTHTEQDELERIKRMCCSDTSSELVRSYCNLKKCTQSKVVVSLTSRCENIDELRPTLNSLMDQSTCVDQIALNLPKQYEYDIPAEYSDM